MIYTHVIWTTYLNWLPSDNRGSWEELSELYSSLSSDFVVEFIKPLHHRYMNKTNINSVSLSDIDRKVIRESIIELSEENGDRIAGGLKTVAIGIGKTEVHILARGNISEIKEKISRLKSRSATLLNVSHESVSSSASNTWSKGLWSVEFNEHEEIFKIKQYINAKNT